MKLIKKYMMLILVIMCMAGCGNNNTASNESDTITDESKHIGIVVGTEVPYGEKDSLYPPFDGDPYIELNNNTPKFDHAQATTESFESYEELDELGRCGETMACIGKDIMPTEERGSISSVKPSGWVNVKYDIIDGKYLYNRCHLIGHQLTGENANERNLITGTRYLNIEGMLPFENMVADFVKETDMHVMYRVTPVYEGDNLVASGVIMEGLSVEDNGEGICFNVYCYNVQPGIEIDYATGESRLATESDKTSMNESKPQVSLDDHKDSSYILNTKTFKIHKPSCGSAKEINLENKQEFKGAIIELLNSGYEACEICKPQ